MCGGGLEGDTYTLVTPDLCSVNKFNKLIDSQEGALVALCLDVWLGPYKKGWI